MSYIAKSEIVQANQLKVQRLSMPFKITGNATPASVAIDNSDCKGLLFLKTEGVDQITAALDSADGSPSLVSQVDANGLFSAMIKIGEPVSKVLCAYIVKRTVHGMDTCKLGATTGISAAGDKILLDCDSSLNLSSATLDACLVLEYVIAE